MSRRRCPFSARAAPPSMTMVTTVCSGRAFFCAAVAPGAKAARRSSSMPSFASLSKVTVYFGSDPADAGCCSVSCSLPPSSVYSRPRTWPTFVAQPAAPETWTRRPRRSRRRSRRKHVAAARLGACAAAA